ncbi:MAG: hydrogenase maturation nickel metallochaperone HypA [Bacteroidota bacterium]|nr:hydrogenase maturation nickel metallochaperone HypA [Bacteroidota bacterium]
MHELSIAMSIVDIASDYAARDNAKHVSEIEIEVGSLAGIVIDALDFAMEAAVKNTICEDAKWNIIELKARGSCPEKKISYEISDLYSACPYCGKFGHELVQGKELRVKSLLVD